MNLDAGADDATVAEALLDLQERVDDLEEELAEERDARREAEARVDALEDELESRAAVRWESDVGNPADIEVEHPHRENKVAVGDKIYETSRLLDDLEYDVHQLKVDGVDAADLVGLANDDDPALPIEDTLDALRSDIRDDPSANKQRATVIFRAFGGRSSTTKGGKCVLESPEARKILEEKAGMTDVNRNTLKRSMKQCAKLTSTAPPSERDAYDPTNLITIERRNSGKLALVADKGEWNEYLEEFKERNT